MASMITYYAKNLHASQTDSRLIYPTFMFFEFACVSRSSLTEQDPELEQKIYDFATVSS